MKFDFIHENAFENVVCQNGGHFVKGKMSYRISPLCRQYSHRSASTLDQVMARTRANAYCRFDMQEQISVKF